MTTLSKAKSRLYVKLFYSLEALMRSKLFSSPTTRTNLNTQIQVLQHRILKQAHKNLSTNISNMTSKLAKGETSTALILLQSLKCRLGNIPCRKCLTGKCFVPNWSYYPSYSMSIEKTCESNKG